MKILLNGAPHDVAADTTLTDLIERELTSLRGSAVVVDGDIVPRGSWPHITLVDGQSVDLITAVPGG